MVHPHDVKALLDEYPDVPLVSISDHQRSPIPEANWQGTVDHGLPRDSFTLHAEEGRYLVYLGRMSPEKRVDRAIEIAQRAGVPLKIAAKIYPEALACGPPVIACRRVSVPEVLEDGVSGYVVKSIEEAVESVRKVDRLSRAGCRQAFEQRFDAERMAVDYVEVYRRVTAAG
jgi:glycosyltransferase involved in cell wall biosynthesis